jgi:hypothetical protein
MYVKPGCRPPLCWPTVARALVHFPCCPKYTWPKKQPQDTIIFALFALSSTISLRSRIHFWGDPKSGSRPETRIHKLIQHVGTETVDAIPNKTKSDPNVGCSFGSPLLWVAPVRPVGPPGRLIWLWASTMGDSLGPRPQAWPWTGMPERSAAAVAVADLLIRLQRFHNTRDWPSSTVSKCHSENFGPPGAENRQMRS